MPETVPSFQFYPRDFAFSRSVVLMSPEERGGYILLLCHAWMSEEPGVLPDDDRTLAILSGLGERWPECRTGIRRAFAQRQRDGEAILVQERMVEERESQKRRRKQSQNGARATNEKRWGCVAQRRDSESLSGRSGVSPAFAFASASAVKDLIPPVGPPLKARRIKATPDRTIPPDFVATCAKRFGLETDVVNLLAERVALEFDARGYKSAKSALLNWCKREKENPTPSNRKDVSHYVPRFYYGSVEDRETPGWEAPGCLSWSSGGILGVELPPPEKWRPLTEKELSDWQAAIARR